MLPVFRVRTAISGQMRDGIFVPSVQAIAAVVAPDRRSVPRVLTSKLPDWDGAALEILGEYHDSDPVWAVRIGTGEPRRFMILAAPTEADVPMALLAMLQPDDPWLVNVQDGWYSVKPIDRTQEGVH